jgi:hypothetical protein
VSSFLSEPALEHPQQFGETLYGQFFILHPAAGLLRYDAKDPVFADTILNPAQNEFLLSRKVRRGWKPLLQIPGLFSWFQGVPKGREQLFRKDSTAELAILQ